MIWIVVLLDIEVEELNIEYEVGNVSNAVRTPVGVSLPMREHGIDTQSAIFVMDYIEVGELDLFDEDVDINELKKRL